MKYLLGVDFGGSSSKATVIDTNGNIVAENVVEYPTYYENLGWCEQKPQDWIEAFSQNVKEVLIKGKIAAKDVLALAVDSATHTWVMCDEHFTPIRPAIHWTDSRSQLEADFLKKEYGECILKNSFHSPNAMWTLPQILWVKKNESENFAKMRYILFEKDYIRYFLTEVYCTDYIDAQGSMLVDANTNKYSKQLLKIAGIDENQLPPIVSPTDIVGKVTKKAAIECGLEEGTPVICGTTDTVLEVLAAGAVNEGDMTVKLATAGRICVITNKPHPNAFLVNYAHVVPGLWYPGTGTKAAAGSLRWFRDTFGGDYREFDALAKDIPIGSQGVVYHPYINGELTPYADPALCGSFIGIRSTHTKAHFTRSVMEGVALSLLHSKKTLEQIGINPSGRATVIGGGARGELWRQITADCLGIELVKTVSSDSSLGSAMLAGVAVGVFKDYNEAVAACVKIEGITKPKKENTQQYEKLFEEYVAIHDALAPIYRSRG